MVVVRPSFDPTTKRSGRTMRILVLVGMNMVWWWRVPSGPTWGGATRGPFRHQPCHRGRQHRHRYDCPPHHINSQFRCYDDSTTTTTSSFSSDPVVMVVGVKQIGHGGGFVSSCQSWV